MTVQRRNILPPYVGDAGHAPDAPSQVDPATGMRATPGSLDSPVTTSPVANNDAMGETGVDSNTQARHVGLVQDHISATNFEKSRAVPGDQTGAGMVIGQSSPLVTKGDIGDAPNQGNPVKGIAGSDSLSTTAEGDSGPNTGAGKTLG